ncbi:MAG: alanine--tRNA ligase, partial [Candidatus Omnitrophica bacterium]|nr:alanine--tRNA ligase [Candidatus Omnitrophota bacterium]
LGDKDNFWPAEAKTKGPNGPCGPCSEIFYDLGKDSGCGKPECAPSCSCGRFVEIWNLVFTQFNRKPDQILEPLPQKNIDTGMGLERLAAVMQGVRNNFETDLFHPIIKEITSYELKNINYELIYAIADHIRAIVFSIYDGVLPANDGRGYVVRKLIRKSVLHLKALGVKEVFLYKLVAVVAKVMYQPYPNLFQRQENIAGIILSEEKNFRDTLDSSEALFRDKFSPLLKNQNPETAGKIAFQLFDTYGIPLDLTVEWLDKHKIKISRQTFEEELQRQKMRSKMQSTMKGDVFNLPELDYRGKKTRFIGYTQNDTKAKIIQIIRNNQAVKKITQGEEGIIILDKSVFYAESGGQVGDTGQIIKGKNVFTVNDTKRIGEVILHIGVVKAGRFNTGGSVSAQIYVNRRLAIARNHTATHLLQAALRRVLGEHIKQQGSLVAEERLRFDFTHFKDISPAELNRIEEEVNRNIIANYVVEKKEKTLSAAKKSGALAFFQEKYTGRVRVVSIDKISKELCAGTHLDATGSIGLFKILQEQAVASGIRRIEAVTGEAAWRMVKRQDDVINEVSSFLNVSPERLPEEIEKKVARIKELEKQLTLQKLDALKSDIDTILQGVQTINGIRLIAKVMEGLDMDLLRRKVDLLKERLDSGIIALGLRLPEKAFLVVGVTADLVERRFDAAAFVKEAAKFIGGSGGGRRDFAQSGGNNPQGLTEAMEAIKSLIEKIQ